MALLGGTGFAWRRPSPVPVASARFLKKKKPSFTRSAYVAKARKVGNNKEMKKSFEPKLINLMVIGALEAFLKKYPILGDILMRSKNPSSDWDFFMTIAATGLYLFTHKISEEKYLEIQKQLSDLDAQMPEGLKNLVSFISQKPENDITENLNTLVGFWVLWNIGNSPPTYEECVKLAPTIGGYLGGLNEKFYTEQGTMPSPKYQNLDMGDVDRLREKINLALQEEGEIQDTLKNYRTGKRTENT